MTGSRGNAEESRMTMPDNTTTAKHGPRKDGGSWRIASEVVYLPSLRSLAVGRRKIGEIAEPGARCTSRPTNNSVYAGLEMRTKPRSAVATCSAQGKSTVADTAVPRFRDGSQIRCGPGAQDSPHVTGDHTPPLRHAMGDYTSPYLLLYPSSYAKLLWQILFTLAKLSVFEDST